MTTTKRVRKQIYNVLAYIWLKFRGSQLRLQLLCYFPYSCTAFACWLRTKKEEKRSVQMLRRPIMVHILVCVCVLLVVMWWNLPRRQHHHHRSHSRSRPESVWKGWSRNKNRYFILRAKTTQIILLIIIIMPQ